MAGRIFVNYRREDSAGYAGWINNRLSDYLGEDGIFIDVNTISAGVDFVAILEDAVQSFDVVIILFIRQWLTLKVKSGSRRLDNLDDLFRIEIAAALKRDIHVITVLVGGMKMASAAELSEDLKPLWRRNTVQIDRHSSKADIYKLIHQLELVLDAAER